MSQQINLLQRPRSRQGAMLWLLLASVLTVVVLLGAWLHLREQNAQLQTRLGQIQVSTAELRAEIVRLSSADNEATRIRAEIALLQPQYESVKDFVTNVRTGPLGRPEGYAPVLALLGQVHAGDSWLTSIELRHRGRQMVLTGVALSDRAAGAYAAQVNRALEGRSLSLQGMELVRQTEQRQGDQGSLPSTVIFKLN